MGTTDAMTKTFAKVPNDHFQFDDPEACHEPQINVYCSCNPINHAVIGELDWLHCWKSLRPKLEIQSS